MSAMPDVRISEDEYFALELSSDIKYEYYRGEVFAMTGASLNHGVIGGNAHASLHSQLSKRPCRVIQNDMRVYIPMTGLYAYPDIVVVCGTPELIPNKPDTLLNPILIIEVLSPSTEDYDRNKKFRHYRTLESLQEYVLISQETARIESYLRQADGAWIYREVVGLDASIILSSIDCMLTLKDVYQKVEFEDPPPYSSLIED